MILFRFQLRFLFLLVIGLFATLQTSSAARHNDPAIVLNPCEIRGVSGAKCGTLEVYENRATRKGRKIGIYVVVMPATGEKREPDPLFYFAGGPGSAAASDDAPGAAQGFARIRERRDLVFVDQRGTGRSNGLECSMYDPKDAQSHFGYFFPLEVVRKCREQLEPNADLTLYTTTIAMDDIDDVRSALGYDKINLFGGSYGTRAATVYLRRYPKRVRSAMLQGISLRDQYLPRDYARDTQRALDGILAECAADEACNKAFPEVKNEAKAVLERLVKAPVETEIRMPDSMAAAKVSMNRDLAAEAIRYMMYHPQSASRVPLFLHLAAQGNFTPLAQAALHYRMNLVGPGTNGMFLSVTCAEDVPWIKTGEGERLAENTFLGDYRVRQQREACALWPRAKIESDYSKPFVSDVPAMIITGEWDPVTPPAYGDALTRTLKNSFHVVVPHGGHGVGGLENGDCITRLSAEFIDRGNANGLDTACVKTIRRRGFALKL
ncbi:MAG TPA: alpha/beta fold hydrolase [Pyrinomonadaceae bacterium]|nr:alpha/beta fold hydrolase [Pyrinomonadaceae bacterium]